MSHSKHFMPLYDNEGQLQAVMLSAEFWSRYRHVLEARINSCLQEMEPRIREEPMQEWETFKQYWDFKYPYCADVKCLKCGARSNDWLNDPDKPFLFKSADLGGLAVFVCKSCGSTIRKKHFKDHICFEVSPGACGGA